MNILGLGGSSHDFAAVLMVDGQIVVGIEEERLTRRRHATTWWFEVPCQRAIDYCLETAGLSIEDIDHIVAGDIVPTRLLNDLPNIELINHHLLHAASIYHYENVEQMAVLSIDGGGSYLDSLMNVGQKDQRETISFYHGKQGHLELLGRTAGDCMREIDSFSKSVSNSIGYFYDLITRSIGFGKYQEGKTMGLAAYGKPVYQQDLSKYITMGESYSDAFLFNPLDKNLLDFISYEIKRQNHCFQVHADFAASGQAIFEKAIFNCAQSVLNKTGANHLGLAGGCALNAVSNGRLKAALQKEGIKLHLLPFANDAGQAFGAIAYKARQLGYNGPFRLKENRGLVDLAHPGKKYSQNHIVSALNKFYPKVEFSYMPESYDFLARKLSEGQIIGIFQGGSEFGPRALGNRSILAYPQNEKIRERLNRTIKHREPFRPIAPMVRTEDFSTYFEGEDDHMFMISTANVKKDKLQEIPSVAHFDGTARVQCLAKENNPLLHRTLGLLGQSGLHPVICNTSFNGPGEPIVETPEDALDCFIRLGLDGLYIEGHWVWRPENRESTH
ncbi:MAG: hypothetical protein HWE34_07795 [Methylocystaceae bacterium]|nr:hypothetical protein [Methylocystaceae bacterium]